MGNIVVQQDPIAEALSSIPDLILKARQLKNQENQTAFNNQLQLDSLELKKSDHEYQKFMRERTDGTLAGGFENNDISEWMYNLTYGKGGFNTSEGLAYDAGDNQYDKIPTWDEAMRMYKSKVIASGKTFNATYDTPLLENFYQKMIQSRYSKLSGQIQMLDKQGYSNDEVAKIIADNPTLAHNVSLMQQIGPQASQAQDFFNPYNPHLPSTGLIGDVGPAGTAFGATLAYTGGQMVYDWANATPDDVIQLAKQNYHNYMKDSRSAVQDAKKYLQEIQSKGSYKGRASDIRAAKELVKEAQDKLKEVAQKGRNELRGLDGRIGGRDTRYRTFMKGEWGKNLKNLKHLQGFAPMLLGNVAGYGAEMIGGEKAGAVVKGGVATGVGGMGLGQFVAKRLAQKAPAMAAKWGLAAAADGPVPIGEVIGLALTIGTSYSTIKDAIEEWNKANRVQK
tara:strand:- start:845 stop:2197 length:1353 start_codon:yes stop_codon:yes gene_type:complete